MSFTENENLLYVYLTDELRIEMSAQIQPERGLFRIEGLHERVLNVG